MVTCFFLSCSFVFGDEVTLSIVGVSCDGARSVYGIQRNLYTVDKWLRVVAHTYNVLLLFKEKVGKK